MATLAVDWVELPTETQAIFGWAAAIEVGGVIGSRGLVLAIMEAAGAESDPDVLLRHFGLTRDDLAAALVRANPQTPLNPSASAPARLSDVPPLTLNGEAILRRVLDPEKSAAPDGTHLFDEILRTPSCTASRALAELLSQQNVGLDSVAAAHGAYLAGSGTSFAVVLEESFPRTPASPTAAAAPDLPTDLELSPTVGAVARVLGDRPVSASELAAGVLARHPEYGGGRAASVRLEVVAGPAVPIPVWFQRVRELLVTPPPKVHGRLLLLALARIDPTLHDGLAADGFLTAVETEISEPLETLFVATSAAFDLAGGISRDAVDPTRGIPLAEDRLGVRTYVAMLAAVIADRETPEPLSIGLFGEWGSGKSYFMGLVREQVEELSKRGGRYCSGIRQIGFNAWHYADTNIWASLGDEIFEQLAGPGPTADEQRERLRDEIAERLQRKKELEAATARAQAETKRLSEELDKAAADRSVRARALAQAAARSPTLQRAWKRIGIDDEVEQGELLAEEVHGTVAEVDALKLMVKGRRGVVLSILAVIVVVSLAGLVMATPALGRWLAGTGAAALAALSVFLGTAIAFLSRIRSGLTLLRSGAGEIASSLDVDPEKLAEGDEQVRAQLGALRNAEAKQRVLQSQHDQVVQQVGELGRELAALSPGQRIYAFVAERAVSEEYRRHLGLISTVRKDFEQLVALLNDWRANEDQQGPGIDRIVLYIDDLDRCSPRQVVDVLQAVHLLLALDLFVVVVGVDPRWLLRSLQSEYDRVLTTAPEGSADVWQASPYDYLEKIFNIPFALPRMRPNGFRALLASHVGQAVSSASDPQPSPPPRVDEPPIPDGDGTAVGLSLIADADVAAEPTSEAATVVEGAPEIELRPMTEPELDLLASLAPLVETPREAKRLANLYRLIRSTRDLRPASQFLGDDSQPGEYQAVVILLGLMSGHGRLLEAALTAPRTERVAGGLIHWEPESTWAEFADGIAPKEVADIAGQSWRNSVVGPIAPEGLAAWRQLHDGLKAATEKITLSDLEAFQFWAPRIARFSFLLTPYPDLRESEATETAGPATAQTDASG